VSAGARGGSANSSGVRWSCATTTSHRSSLARSSESSPELADRCTGRGCMGLPPDPGVWNCWYMGT
jgi:hypothetical protein